MRAADVTVSDWECTLEFTAGREPALRLGLCLVKGLSKAGGERLVAERQKKPFDSVNQLAVRAQLNAKDLHALAAAGSFATLTGHRAMRFKVSGIDRCRLCCSTRQCGECSHLLPSAKARI